MDEMKEMGTPVQEMRFEKSMQPELSTEVVLPDYRSEISRLLWVRPTALPPVCFKGNAGTDVSGKICYHILYAGPDGKLYSAEAEDAYDVTLPLAEGENPQFSVVVEPHTVVGRAVAPRRLQLRCRLQIKACGYEEKEWEELLSPDVSDAACLLGGNVCGAEFFSSVGEAVEVNDAFPAPAEEGEIVTAWGEVLLGEAVAGVDSARLRGEASVCVLWQAGEGEDCRPKVLTRRIPCAFEVPMADVSTEDKLRAWATVCEVCAVNEAGSISVAVRLVPVIEGQREREIYYVKDLFLQGFDTKCHCNTQKIWQAKACANRNFSVSHTAEHVTGLPAGAEILCAWAEAELAPDGEKSALRGELHCHMLYRKGTEFGVSDAALPTRLDMAGVTPQSSAVCRVPLCHARAEGSGVRVDAEVAVARRTAEELEVRPVAQVEAVPSASPYSLDVELCYPGKGETLWEVAKRYGVAPCEIAAANGVPLSLPADEVLVGEKPCLFVPVR